MVFKLIKNIFKKTETKVLGELTQNKKLILEKSTMSIENDHLLFKNDHSEVSYEIKKFTDLELLKNGLVFTYGHKKYKYSCNDDLKEIYDNIHPLIYSCPEIFKAKDFLYNVYDPETSKFTKVNEDVLLRIIEDQNLFYLKIETNDDVIHFEEITTETQYYMDNKSNTFVWSVMKDGSWYTFSVIFKNNLEYLEFLSKYVSSTYKTFGHEEEKYYEKMEIENYEVQNEDEEYCSLSDEEEEIQEDDEVQHFGKEDEQNELLVVGNENAFVTRGHSVGVFRNTNDGLQFKENLEDVLDGSAKKMIPHNKSSSLIYLNENEKDILRKIDLERSDVVETWKINRDINDYFDSTKLNDSGTLVGLSDYSVFRIDPRTKDKVTEEKTYKTKNEFLCGMSTSKGHVAVASKNGDLRLYDKIDKRAKSLLPGFGDEVKAVDVTSDGRHIICTCKNYLMLFTVDGDYKKAVGKNKPVPKKLHLKPEHLAYINEEINFTPAKFSTDNLENNIISSTGKYVIKWNLEDVLNGFIYSYTISRCNDLVVADNFEFGNNDSIIVTLPNDVRSLKAAGLKRPDKRTW